jgi:hypothetical protein
MPGISSETSPLLPNEETRGQDGRQVRDMYQINPKKHLTFQKLIEFSKEDPSNPRAWSKSKKLANIVIIASMARKSHLSFY